MTTVRRGQHRQWALAGVVVLLVAAMLAGIAPAQTKPVTLRVGMASLSEKVDPHTIWAPPGPTAFAPMFDALTWMDAQGRLQPALATSWRRVNDTTWEFKLREQVKFQNGEPFDADDVKVTFERLLDKEKVAKFQLIARGQVGTVSGIEVVDRHTVRLITSTPDAVLPRSLPVVFILPGDYYRQVGDDGIATRPVGTGPFKLTEFQKGTRIVFEAWDGSWRGRPKVDQLMQILLPEAATRLSALRTGEIDIAHFVPPDQAAVLQRAGFQLVAGPAAAQYLCDIWDVQGPLADRRVREALNYAVDKEAIVKDVMKGYASVAAGQPFVPNTLGFDPGLKPYPYDLERAKKLLAEAGYPNGFELRFQHSVGFILNDGLLAQAIQGYLAQIGVRVKLEPLEYAVFRQWYFRGDRGPLYCWKMLNYPQLDAASGHRIFFYPSATPIHPLPGGKTPKETGWVNEKYRALVDAAQATGDESKRAALSQQATAALHADVIHLYMIQYHNLFATRPDVQGLVPRADENIFFDPISKGR
jgi:peptide/nickel transport system substrate-binding protein